MKRVYTKYSGDSAQGFFGILIVSVLGVFEVDTCLYLYLIDFRFSGGRLLAG